MRPILYVLAALLALALSAGVLLADGCPTPARVVVRHSYAPVVVAPVVVKPVVVKKVVVEEVPVILRYTAVIPLVEYGSYSATYVPPVPVAPIQAQPQQSQAQQAQPSEMARVLAALELMSKRIERLEQGDRSAPLVAPPAPKPKQAPQPKQEPTPDALSVVRNKCAACHEESVAVEKGAGLVLLKGGALETVTARKANKVIARVYAGTMPPKDSGFDQLDDAEVATMVTHYAPSK